MKEILTALVNIYQKKGSAVKTIELTEFMNNRSPGTIRNLMQTMRTLMIVRSIPGVKGGYLPNSSILHVLGDIRDFKVGDKIKIASRKLIISGIVEDYSFSIPFDG